MNLGYVNLFRKFKQWEWYRDPVVKNVFIELMLDVNYQDRKWQGMEIKKGQTVTSLPKIADAVNLSIQQVRTALKKLESTGEITTVATGKGRVITLCNFDDYNSDKTKSNRQNEARSNRVATGFPTGNQQTINRQYATGEELPESPLEWGSQPVDCLLATDDQQAKTGEKTGELTGILTPNNKVLIKNKEEEKRESGRVREDTPSRMAIFWERHRNGESISENSRAVISETLIKSVGKKKSEQPHAKARRVEPVVIAPDPEQVDMEMTTQAHHEPQLNLKPDPDVEKIELIQAAYVKRGNPIDVARLILDSVKRGTDLDNVLSRTKAYSEIMRKNEKALRFVPSAYNFFADEKWQEDESVWRAEAAPRGRKAESRPSTPLFDGDEAF